MVYKVMPKWLLMFVYLRRSFKFFVQWCLWCLGISFAVFLSWELWVLDLKSDTDGFFFYSTKTSYVMDASI